MSRIGLLGHMGTLFLTFWVAAPFYIPSVMNKGFSFLHPRNTCYIVYFISAFPLGMKWYFTVVLICISIKTQCWTSFHVLIGHSHNFLENYLFKSFAHLKLSYIYLVLYIVYYLYSYLPGAVYFFITFTNVLYLFRWILMSI